MGRGSGGSGVGHLREPNQGWLTKTSLLDSQIRMVIDKFGIAAVRIAWNDPKQVTEHVLNGYTKVI